MTEVKKLNQLEFFSTFSGDQLEKLSKISVSKFFKKGELVYRKGESATEFFVVIKGNISLDAIDMGNGQGISFEERKQGEFFGPASFMASGIYSLTAECLTDAEIMVMNTEKLSALCEEDNRLGYKIMKKIAEIYFDRYITIKRQIGHMLETPTIITALPG